MAGACISGEWVGWLEMGDGELNNPLIRLTP